MGEVPSDELLLVLVSAALLVTILVTVRRSGSAARVREELLCKLPSPGGWLPVIGHLHMVGSQPHVSLGDLAAKHSRDGLMLLRLGSVPTLIVTSSNAARAVLRTHDDVFASRPHNPATDIIFYGPSDIAFCPYGDHWRQVKKIAMTHLLTANKVRSYRQAREEEACLVVAKLRDAMAAGAALDLGELLSAFSTNIVGHAVCGKSFRQKGHEKLFRELVETNSLLIGGFNVGDYFPELLKLDIIRWMVCGRARRVNKMWDDLLESLIHEHESKPAPALGDDTDYIHDLLSIQKEYNLTREQVKAQLVIMFGAGTDTSYIVMEYAMARLMQNPDLMTKLQAEVRSSIPKGKHMVTEDDLNHLAYLKAVIKETLRLHMPAPLLVPHLAMADCVINGYTIPSGTRVIVNSRAIARDPSSWESAEEFLPERFMQGGSAAAMDYKGNGFLYLPFGTGRRICPGINFAIAAIEIMLANLVYHFDWKLPPGSAERGISMTESFGLTVHRKDKLLLVPLVPQDYET
ncbi:Cytochrome P450 71C2 [Hordeum vulgare]|nr:Cytochrome P450 71C2 [Hordeum vulgare]